MAGILPKTQIYNYFIERERYLEKECWKFYIRSKYLSLNTVLELFIIASFILIQTNELKHKFTGSIMCSSAVSIIEKWEKIRENIFAYFHLINMLFIKFNFLYPWSTLINCSGEA